MNILTVGMKISELLADILTADISDKERHAILKSVAGTCLVAYMGTVKDEFVAQELINLIATSKKVKERVDGIMEEE